MNIKNIVMGVAIGSLMLAAAAPAFAADWIDIDGGKEADKDSVKRLSNGWDIWVRVPAKSAIFRVQVNCDDGSYTLIAGGTYSSNNADVDTFPDPTAEAAVPGTFGHRLYEGLCKP